MNLTNIFLCVFHILCCVHGKYTKERRTLQGCLMVFFYFLHSRNFSLFILVIAFIMSLYIMSRIGIQASSRYGFQRSSKLKFFFCTRLVKTTKVYHRHWLETFSFPYVFSFFCCFSLLHNTLCVYIRGCVVVVLVVHSSSCCLANKSI